MDLIMVYSLHLHFDVSYCNKWPQYVTLRLPCKALVAPFHQGENQASESSILLFFWLDRKFQFPK